MIAKKISFFLLTTLLAGCVPVMSLHPLYTEENVVFEEKMLGIWTDDPNNPEIIFEFKRFDEYEKAYELLIYADKSTTVSFISYLVKLDNKLFLDIYPKEKINGPNAYFLLPTHTFIKIDSIESNLEMRLTDDDEMKKLLKQDPNSVQHTYIEDTPILTAPTKELQNFVIKYADDENLFSNQIILTKMIRQKNDAPKAVDPNDKSKADKR